MRNGAIDEEYMDFQFYDDETITSENPKCLAGRYGPRLYQEHSWCSGTSADSNVKITFPYLFTIHGIYLEFEDVQFNPDFVDITYSTLQESTFVENVDVQKDVYNSDVSDLIDCVFDHKTQYG